MDEAVTPDQAKPATEEEDRPFGPVAAAFLAAAFGALVLGFLTTLAEASEAVKDFLQFSDAVGPLSGKTSISVAAWIVAWPILHLALRRRDPSPARVYWVTAVLLVAGLIGTFPSFFQRFAAE